MKYYGSYFLLILVFNFYSLSYSKAFSDTPKNLTKDCLDFINTIPPDYRYGWISAPENWSKGSSSKKIQIFYYTNWSPNKIPVVYFNGGPLSSSHYDVESFQNWVNRFNLGMIYFDQRGTGCSNPFPFKMDFETLKKSSLYDSNHIALDAEIIRKKLLDHRPWKVLGHSQGGVMAYRYLTYFPQKVISAHVYATLNVESFQDFYFVRILGQYRVLKKLEALYPKTREQIQAGLSRLTENDCIDVSSKKVCGPVLLQTLYLYLDGNPHKVKKLLNKLILPSGVVDLNAVKTELSFIFDYFFSDQFHAAQSILRQEFRSINDLMILSHDCELAYKSLEVRGITRKDLIIDECQLIKYVINNDYKYFYSKFFPQIEITRQLSLKSVINSLESVPNSKLYIYSAGMDPMAGSISHFAFAKWSKQIIHKHYENLGHSSHIENADLWKDLARK